MPMLKARYSILPITILFCSGCALTRGELDIRVDLPANPPEGPTVWVAPPTDDRTFEHRPRRPSIPSLKKGEINDPSITSRAIARKRNSFGKALGDILLPEGRTVQELVREAVVQGLRTSGYRVTMGDTPGDSAQKVNTSINKLWAWMNPGFWTIGIEFEAELTLTGLPGQSYTVLKASHERRGMAAGSGAWRRVISEGIDELVFKIRKAAAHTRSQPPNLPSSTTTNGLRSEL